MASACSPKLPIGGGSAFSGSACSFMLFVGGAGRAEAGGAAADSIFRILRSSFSILLFQLATVNKLTNIAIGMVITDPIPKVTSPTANPIKIKHPAAGTLE